ncbi:MAG: hypothetical protein EXX96DRAFT_51363 [Benjaminiella poitrasii]|nr:MAG: hypothetical protein EXX96DRAFT_51363 [Benjaminiella poitrasii]
MKFSAIAVVIGSAFASLASAAFQNLQSTDFQLNITSPLNDGVYVAGRALPLIYIPANPANLNLNIYLRPVITVANETTIAHNADISSDGVAITVDNKVYFEHSINYMIPTTTPAGSYEVIYQNTNTNTNTTIPITINAYVLSTTVIPTATDITLQPSTA